MGFFKALTTLLDENSDQSFEKKIIGAIDRVEQTLNETVDKAETGIKQIDTVGQKAIAVSETVDKATQKIQGTIDKQ